MKKCPCCFNKSYYKIFDFGLHPWCGDFRDLSDRNPVKKYPLKIVMCKSCKLVRLTHYIPKKIMFSKTTYLSGSSDELLLHFKNLSLKIKSKFKLTKNSNILDIGSNDGSFLKYFKSSKILGVESAKNLCDISNNNGVKTINGYFNFPLAKKIKNKFDLIHGSGVMFHLEEINSAFKGIKLLLEENGILVIEFLYLKTIIDKFYFDQIYHEHLFYYNIETLNTFLKKYDLEIFDFELSSIHGGQVVAYISHKGGKKIKKRLQNALFKEKKYKVNTPGYFKKFCSITNKSKNTAIKKLDQYRDQNKIIVGLGAPAKGNTLMNYYNLNNQHIDLLVEKNPLRINKLSPGSNIPIMMESDLRIKPDIFLVLIWNLKNDIKKKIRKKFKGSKFIFPKDFLKYK